MTIPEHEIELVQVYKNQLLGLFWDLKVTDSKQIKQLMDKKYLYYSPAIGWFRNIQYPVANWNINELAKLTSQQLLDLYLELKK